MNASRARVGLTLILAIYGFTILRDPGMGSFIDNVDLPIHETGHLVFSPFGEFMQFLGGTLFQVIVPCVFVGYFWRKRDRFAASMVLWWVGQNFWNISVYVRDARNQDLDLVGGGEHDWAYLLGELGLLKQDQRIAQAVWMIGVVIYIAAIVGGYLSSSSAQKSEEVAEPALS
jgi:hypothetical protein